MSLFPSHGINSDLCPLSYLIGSVAFEIFMYTSFSVNFCFKCIPSCNSPEMYYIASWTDSVCILTVRMKRVRKLPAQVSSKYPTLSYVAGS